MNTPGFVDRGNEMQVTIIKLNEYMHIQMYATFSDLNRKYLFVKVCTH